MEDIGQRIRKERLKHKLTLEQLSQKTNLSKSFLSQMERGLAQPSITSLKKISLHLGISVVKFFDEEENGGNLWRHLPRSRERIDIARAFSPDVRVVRSNRRKGITLPGSKIIYEVLTPDLNRQLEVMYMRISEGEKSGDEPMLDPPGEKFGVVLNGKIEMQVGEKPYELDAGDSICFPANVSHSWCGLQGDPIEVIWVQTPPTF
jgi:transcriptional regulator with XRE-family HTH domain